MKTTSTSRRSAGLTILVGASLAALVSMPLAVPFLFGEDDAANAFETASAACPDRPGTYDCLYEFPPSNVAAVKTRAGKPIDCGADDAGYDCDEAETAAARPSSQASIPSAAEVSPYRPGEGG